MVAILGPRHYTESKYLNSDIEVFNSSWIYVGMRADFALENQFITKQIGGISIVVQNLKGVIKAFKNVCSHRHSKIQVDKCGVRPLICPYHGWTYDSNGKLRGIPKRPLFVFPDNMDCLSLQPYEVELCGNLVFVNLGSDLSLREYLGAFYFYIEKFGNGISQEVDVNEMTIGANWKVLVENTLESYHVSLVHSNSFQRLGASGMNFIFDDENGHSMWEAELILAESEGKNQFINAPFKVRNLDITGYDHLYVFPNLLLSTTYGISFNISEFFPVSSDSSIFTSKVYISNYDESKSEIVNMYAESLKSFNRQVFNEDKEICEQVQRGMEFSHYVGQLSDEERRVLEFQRKIFGFY